MPVVDVIGVPLSEVAVDPVVVEAVELLLSFPAAFSAFLARRAALLFETGGMLSCFHIQELFFLEGKKCTARHVSKLQDPLKSECYARTEMFDAKKGNDMILSRPQNRLCLPP